ncbi:MAG: HEPN domain-containing protein [Deltaproteobacteria bacterium]|nr:HEPN domain-containing protein [Deltaproteobacteria bacterium]
MKPTTLEWIAKAEGDFATLCREARARLHPNYDAACFHAQQCAEKYLKARLCEAGTEFAKIHDLVALLEQALIAEPTWEALRADLAYLSDFAIAYRYPGEAAEKRSAQDALRRCRRFRIAARTALGLDTTSTHKRQRS